MHAVGAAQVAEWTAMGMDELVLTTDIEVLRGAFDDLLADARAALGVGGARQPRRGSYGAAR